MFRLRAEGKGLFLAVEMKGEVPQVMASDEVKLRQILINLLNNAMKFTEEGGVTLRVVRRRPHPDKALVRFEVQDTGPGIADDFVKAAFESFTQLDASQHRPEGTGLGLTISRRFAQLLGGDIEVSLPTLCIFRFLELVPFFIVEVSERTTL